ncbi:MAG: hypothetical protein AAFQ07_02925 [Chloroflexota bacterium]
MSRKQLIIEQAKQQILEAFPNVIAMRIIGAGGDTLPQYDYDADPDNIPGCDRPYEDAIAPMTIAILSFMERSARELTLGKETFAYLASTKYRWFTFKLGDEDPYMMSVLFDGTPSVDTLSEYFKKQDWFWYLTPFIEK